MKKWIALILAALCVLGSTALADADAETLRSYQHALEQLKETYQWPDGDYAADITYQTAEEFSENLFSIIDIDRDGTDELLVIIESGSMAETVVRFYKLIDGKLTCVLAEYPWLECYDNGVVLAYASHNQTESEFWPFSVLQFESYLNGYVDAGNVYAVDKGFSSTTEFPDGVDADGDGTVFYIGAAGEYNTDDPCDNADFESWLQWFIGDAQEITPEWQKLTEENIAAITR